jgi:TonB family protein
MNGPVILRKQLVALLSPSLPINFPLVSYTCCFQTTNLCDIELRPCELEDMTDSELRAAMETHHSESYGWALSCCARSSVEAEAVLQTVYLKVLTGKARYDGKVQPSYPPIAKAANASGPVQVQILVSETGEVLDAYAISGHPLFQDAAVQAARRWVFKSPEVSGRPIKARGILTFNFELTDEVPSTAQSARSATKPTTKTESLGKHMAEGVECEGERAVTTMPAGTIGNDRPIETVNETWYSPELKIMILSKRSDPRFGESTYSVTNIIRSEPYAELFLPPSDYKLIDGDSKKQITLDLEEIKEMRRKIEELEMKVKGSRKPNEQ